MPIMINHGKEMLCISPKDNKKINIQPIKAAHGWFATMAHLILEFFYDLMGSGKEFLGTTNKKLFYSINDERTWVFRKH